MSKPLEALSLAVTLMTSLGADERDDLGGLPPDAPSRNVHPAAELRA